MTRDQVESKMWRAGLTSAQIAELLPAADAYATSQAKLAIDAQSYTPPAQANPRLEGRSMNVVHFADELSQMLSRIHGHAELRWTACGWSADDGTKLTIVTDRAAVSCHACKRTTAYRKEPA